MALVAAHNVWPTHPEEGGQRGVSPVVCLLCLRFPYLHRTPGACERARVFNNARTEMRARARASAHASKYEIEPQRRRRRRQQRANVPFLSTSVLICAPVRVCVCLSSTRAHTQTPGIVLTVEPNLARAGSTTHPPSHIPSSLTPPLVFAELNYAV